MHFYTVANMEHGRPMLIFTALCKFVDHAHELQPWRELKRINSFELILAIRSSAMKDKK